MVSAVERVKRSNREAARLFTDMLSSFSTNMVILFPSEDEAREARKVWGVTVRAQVLSIDAPDAAGFGKLRSRRFSALEQEQALLASEGVYVPEGTEVLIIAGPRSKDLKKIRRLHERLGEDCVIVLLNGRLSAQDILQQSATVLEECSQLKSIFTPVFHYAPPALSNQGGDKDRELLLYHEYAGKWSLAEKDKDSKGILGLKLGSSVFKTLWEGDSFPEASLIQSTLSTVNK